MSFKEFLVELRQLIHERAVISCIHPKLVALGAVNELTTLNHAHPGLTCSSRESVESHLRATSFPALVFVTEHLADSSGLDLIHSLDQSPLDHRSILILTHNHALEPAIFESSALSGVVLDHNIGGPTCVLTKALRAVNQGQQFVDPELNQNQQITTSDTNRLSGRELEVLRLAANGMSNKEVGAKLFIAPTTARDHMQSVMRKLNVRSRTAAAVAGLKLGLLGS